MPRNTGLTTIAADQIWCGELVESGSIVIAGEHFSDVAERAIERQQGIGAQIRVRGICAVIAVFANRGPSGEQRPDGAEVVAAAVVLMRAVGNDAHAPIGLVISARRGG